MTPVTRSATALRRQRRRRQLAAAIALGLIAPGCSDRSEPAPPPDDGDDESARQHDGAGQIPRRTGTAG